MVLHKKTIFELSCNISKIIFCKNIGFPIKQLSEFNWHSLDVQSLNMHKHYSKTKQ